MMKRTLSRLAILDSAREMRSVIRIAAQRFRWAAGRGFGKHDRRMVEQYLGTHKTRALYLGAGNQELDGWLNSDLYPGSRASMHLDATQPFPLSSNSFRYVFSNHMIEHLTFREGMSMLRESLRVLEPGGVMRVSTPDFAFLVDLYTRPPDRFIEDYLGWQLGWINRRNAAEAPLPDPVFVVNNYVRDWGHKFIYNRNVLRHALQAAGFENVVDRNINDSPHEMLRDIEHEERAPDGFVALETMTMEAYKPRESATSNQSERDLG